MCHKINFLKTKIHFSFSKKNYIDMFNDVIRPTWSVCGFYVYNLPCKLKYLSYLELHLN